MKKILLALGFALVATSAQSAHLTTVGALQLNTGDPAFGSVVFSGDTHDVINVGGSDATSGVFGQLSALQDTTFAVTFLGKEAANVNFYVSNGSQVAGSGTNVVTVGQSFYFDVAAGVIDFGFTGSAGLTASNLNTNNQRIAYIQNDGTYIDANTGKAYAFLIGFNDGGSRDGDYDDYVVGVSAVPVPAALPLMASALGAFGIARRRNKAKAV
ncbi:MAG: VPLPA-CTERM sorting domain-containing protein [Pseudomonadota bacterium]